MTTLQRRGFLSLGLVATGGLLVGCSASDPRDRGLAAAPSVPAGGNGAALNAWVRLEPGGEVVVVVPRSEMGQGVHTSLAMLVAEELEADWSRVRVEQAPPGRVYANTALLWAALPLQPDDRGWMAQAARWGLSQAAVMLSLNVTGGSTSVRAAWEPMRWAGAAARSVLEQVAARQWGVAVDTCRARNGEVIQADGVRRASFGELAGQWSRKPLAPQSDLRLKAPSQWRLIGQSPRRLDSALKSTGSAAFGADLALPGLRRAVLRTCPHIGGRLVKVHDQAARAVSGVREVHAFADWPVPAVAVVADSSWQALKGAKALELEWDAGLYATLDSEQMRQTLKHALDEPHDTTSFRKLGDAAQELSRAPSKLEAEYEVPYLAHAPMEPLNATAKFDGKRLTLWVGTQSPILARWAAARIADLPIEAVDLHIPYLGGGFGRRLEVDVVEQVTHLALKMPGTPVQLIWTREQDLQHDVYRPAAMARLEAGLQGERLQACRIRIAGPSVSDSTTRRLLPAELTAPMPVAPDKAQVEGAYDLPYGIPHFLVEQTLTDSALPMGYWRGVGHTVNAFFTECFIDEIAQALKQDPLKLRLDLLADRPRHRAVLQAAAQLGRWGQPPPAGRARGLALHESFGSICAQVAEVSLDGRGRVRVHQIACALDAGTIVHPDGVKAQLESAIVFGLSAALWGEVPVRDGRVALSSWADHPVLRLSDTPRIDSVLMPSSAEPGGVGEPGTPPVAPAVANALARVDGRRRRRLPLDRG